MDAKVRVMKSLVLENGRCPFDEWLDGLGDVALMRAVDARLTRIRDGNFGDHKSLGHGVYELRIDRGPGLRVYYGLDGDEIVILLGGGDKHTQSKDIRRAQHLWGQYKR